MVNAERLLRISSALGLEGIDLVEIFEYGGFEMSETEAELLLMGKNKNPFEYEALEMFLNGLIIFNRGQEPNQPKRLPTVVEDLRSINNVVLKKLKIAFSLSSEDMLDLFASAGVEISKEKLSCLFRKEGHKSYKYCRDVYMIGFLKALEAREMM